METDIREIEKEVKHLSDWKRIDDKVCNAMRDLDGVILTNDGDVARKSIKSMKLTS